MDIANPIGTVLSAAMMLRYSFDMASESDCIENAVSAVLDKGFRTADIMPSESNSEYNKVGCSKMGDLILENLRKE